MDKMKKLFLLGCSIVILSVIVLVVVVLINNRGKAKELVCTSNNGNITLYYDKDTLVGYKANSYTYDLLSEKSYAEETGVKKYIEEFSNKYATNTGGTCK